ncbi:MAG: ATP-binding cassette domain-containing protein [Myxococcales bacterium]|nr:ATP-binding cassette domain-containing protein [Myxococcales bacterium]
MIRLDHVSKRYGPALVLDDVSLTLPPGGTLGLVGAGGAGKSLVLKLLCGLIKPDTGHVWLGDTEVSALDERRLMTLRERIGMVFQNYALFDHLTVADNIGFPLAQMARPPAEITTRVATRLAQVHLPHIGPLYPRELSGGMKKRVCLARATVHDPPIMLCDDPTAGLDPVTTNRIFRLLKDLQAQNAATAIIVSHETTSLEPICDHLALLDHGRLIHAGPTAEAMQHPAVHAFMTGHAAEPLP